MYLNRRVFVMAWGKRVLQDCVGVKRRLGTVCKFMQSDQTLQGIIGNQISKFYLI